MGTRVAKTILAGIATFVLWSALLYLLIWISIWGGRVDLAHVSPAMAALGFLCDFGASLIALAVFIFGAIAVVFTPVVVWQEFDR